ncbi:hypothetical protein BC628DRAFT_1316521 [Trametes gibbosa]|nr:hypothetical protein BC628DRAFT_1316521 [Trametes gibbosa]
MPLLNLPTLPPPAPSQPARPGRPTAPLRSIPALPMQGPIDAGQEADHESASLEDEEEEEDGDDHADGASAEGQDGESGESGDEEDHDFHETSLREPVATERPFGLGTLPEVDTSRFSVSFADATTASSSRAQRTPHVHTGPFIDYFSSKSPELAFSPMRTPRPTDFQPGGADRTQDVPQLRTVPMPSSSPRPELYHLGSRSMIDLSMSRKDKDTIISPKLGHSLSRKKPRAPIAAGPSSNLEEVEEPEPQVEIPEDVIASPMLRRRRSLPVYEPSSDPPPYPDQQFLRRGPKADILPRDDEGCERLPQYSNAIFLAAVMPRKVEFTQPGVQAKDRKWRRVYCVLEGTMLRVYKAPPAGSRVSAIEQWWENKVGVGDITSVDTAAMTTSGIRVSAVHERPREQDTERPPKIVEESGTGRASESAADAEGNSASHPSSPQLPPSRSRFHLGSRLLHSQRSKSTSRLGSNHSSSSSRVSLDSRHDNPRPSVMQHTRRSMDTLGSSRTSNTSLAGTHVTTSTTLTTPSPSSSASSPTLSSSDGVSRSSRNRFLPHTHSSGDSKEKGKEKDAAYVPDPKDLLQKYTLQNAESGLASDYVKRKNVIRVRMGGEQFLLQATDVAAVIDWIESIQMGTNVALDLDERPMPRGPIFPRRRRRRPRRVEPSASGS